MKKLFKYVAVFALILVVGSSAWANTYSEHVKIAPNGQGDLLYFPFYLANSGGWETKITITNTDMVSSVVAKVSVRDAKISQDILDFLIFLSPADVWTGRLQYNAAMKAVTLKSEDDSVQNSTGAFASAAAPFEYALRSAVEYVDYTQGYIEVIEANSFGLAPFAPGVPKSAISAAYGLKMYDRQYTIPALSGKMEVKNVIAGLNATLSATTLQNYNNTVYLSPGQSSVVGLQESVNGVPVSGSQNVLQEVEAALSKTEVAMPYVKNAAGESAYHIFTFPTKYSNWLGQTRNSDFFTDHGKLTACNSSVTLLGAVEYVLDIFDLRENRKNPVLVSPYIGTYLCYEMNFLSTLAIEQTSAQVTAEVFPFAEGWARYSFGNIINPPIYDGYVTVGQNKNFQNLTYTGAPVIASYLYFDVVGNLTAGYPSWTNGEVFAGATTAASTKLVDYQYTNNTKLN